MLLVEFNLYPEDCASRNGIRFQRHKYILQRLISTGLFLVFGKAHTTFIFHVDGRCEIAMILACCINDINFNIYSNLCGYILVIKSTLWKKNKFIQVYCNY